MSLTLLTYPALARSQKILVVSELAGVKVTVDTNVTADQLKAKSTHGKVPCLVTPEGSLSESNAICRYIGRLQPASGVLGRTPIEQAQVDSWMDWAAAELEIPVTLIVAPILGWMDNNPQVTARAKADMSKALAFLDAHLATETFIVNRLSMADVSVATTLLLPLKLVLDEKARKPFAHVMRWFSLVSHQKAFIDVCGEVTLCVKPLEAKASAAVSSPAKAEAKPKAEANKPKEEKPKAEAKPKEDSKPKAEKRKQEDLDEPEEIMEEKKAKNPLDDLPKSPMVLDAWKREYSNAPGGDCYKAMPYFWQNFDAQGYSLWFCEYLHNDELTVTFKTSNLVGGFIQRSDGVRKYAFGVMQIVGTASAQKIVGAWLMRGQDMAPMLAENEDAEQYKWTKLSQPPTEAEKKRLELLWCEGDVVEGQQILDCKVFK